MKGVRGGMGVSVGLDFGMGHWRRRRTRGRHEGRHGRGLRRGYTARASGGGARGSAVARVVPETTKRKKRGTSTVLPATEIGMQHTHRTKTHRCIPRREAHAAGCVLSRPRVHASVGWVAGGLAPKSDCAAPLVSKENRPRHSRRVHRHQLSKDTRVGGSDA